MILENFEGFVDQIRDGIAYVTLKSVEHGDTMHGTYPAAELLNKGIRERRRFKCATVENGPAVEIQFEAIPDKALTPEEEKEIYDRIERMLGDCQ